MSDLNDAAPAPSSEEAMPVTDTTTPEPSLDDELSAAYDKLNADQPEPDDAESDVEPVEEEQETEAETEAESEPVELPLHLPSALKGVWGDIPEEARGIIDKAHQEMSAKTGDAMRQLKGMEPIKESLVEAIKANPAIANMKPEEVARQVPEIIRIGQRMNADPVNTILTLAQQHNVLDQVSQMLTGQAPQGGQAAQQEIAALKQEIQQLKNPEWVRRQYDEWNAETTTLREIEEFSGSAEAWADVEPHIPQVIPIAREKLGDSAPAKAVLEEAYKMAIQLFMPDKAKDASAAAQAAPQPDPAKVQKAKQAKSINVKSQSADKPRPQSLDEELGALYDRLQA